MSRLLVVVFIFCFSISSFAEKKKSSSPKKKVTKSGKVNKSKSTRTKKKSRKKSKDPYKLRRAKYHYNKHNYNLSLYYLFAHLKDKNASIKRNLEFAEKVLAKTGTLPLYIYDVGFLKQIDVPTVAVHLASFYFKEKDYNSAARYAVKVPKDSSYYPEAQFTAGSSLMLLGKKAHIVHFENCIKGSKKRERSIHEEKYKRYFVMLREKCLINKSRQIFKDGHYKKSNQLYNEIAKVSYSWPFVLLEKAWNYYHTKDYNRSLGLLMTYQSPLLESYFFPEAEILKALSYYQLCLYRDAAFLIDKFFKIYKKKSNTLVSFIKSAASSKFYFKLIYEEKEKIKQHPFILNLRNQLRKKLRINLHLSSYGKAKDEYTRLTKSKKSKKEAKFLKFTLDRMERLINKHVKEYFYFFINQINYFSYEMFNIKLEIITRKKDLLYENKKLVASRARGSLDNVNREEDEFFFTFTGAFWADELGDYSFGLRSNCKSYKSGSLEN